jgi:DNA-binding NtrC family response regulator
MTSTFFADMSTGSGQTQRIEPRNSPLIAKKSTSPRILIVDDEPLLRWWVGETLGEHGHEVIEASDATSALDVFRRAAGDTGVVLLDLCLPDSNDLHVLSAMHAMSPATPVILMTAHGTPELFEAARQLGAFASVDKPFELDDLASLVDRALVSHDPGPGSPRVY